MNTFNCKRSRWLYNHALDYLGRFIGQYSGQIKDGDVFQVLDESDGAENVIGKIVKKCLTDKTFRKYTNTSRLSTR